VDFLLVSGALRHVVPSTRSPFLEEVRFISDSLWEEVGKELVDDNGIRFRNCILINPVSETRPVRELQRLKYALRAEFTFADSGGFQLVSKVNLPYDKLQQKLEEVFWEQSFCDFAFAMDIPCHSFSMEDTLRSALETGINTEKFFQRVHSGTKLIGFFHGTNYESKCKWFSYYEKIADIRKLYGLGLSMVFAHSLLDCITLLLLYKKLVQNRYPNIKLLHILGLLRTSRLVPLYHLVKNLPLPLQYISVDSKTLPMAYDVGSMFLRNGKELKTYILSKTYREAYQEVYRVAGKVMRQLGLKTELLYIIDKKGNTELVRIYRRIIKAVFFWVNFYNTVAFLRFNSRPSKLVEFAIKLFSENKLEELRELVQSHAVISSKFSPPKIWELERWLY